MLTLSPRKAAALSAMCRTNARHCIAIAEAQGKEGNVSMLRRWLIRARSAMASALEFFSASRLTGHYWYVRDGAWVAVVRTASGAVAWASARHYGKRQSAQRAAKKEAIKRMALLA